MTTNGNSGQVPTRIVELLISNINELTKQVQQMPSQISDEVIHDLESLAVAITSVLTKITTPPRNEELDKKLDDTLYKVDGGHEEIRAGITALSKLIQEQLIDKIKWMTRSVWLTFTLFSAVVIISSIFLTIFNKPSMDVNEITSTEKVMTRKLEDINHKLLKRIDVLLEKAFEQYTKDVDKKSDGVTPGDRFDNLTQ